MLNSAPDGGQELNSSSIKIATGGDRGKSVLRKLRRQITTVKYKQKITTHVGL